MSRIFLFSWFWFNWKCCELELQIQYLNLNLGVNLKPIHQIGLQSGLGDPAIPYLYFLCWDNLIKSDEMFHNIWEAVSLCKEIDKLFKLYPLAHSVVGPDRILLTHAAFSATTNQTRPNHVPLTTVGRSRNCRTIKLAHSPSPPSKMVSIKCDISSIILTWHALVWMPCLFTDLFP